jgi:uncharacterized damage-inducible protein DinB
MSEIPWETVVESSGASFDSIRDIFVHSLQAEHLWIRRVNGKSTEGIYTSQDAAFSKYTGVNSIREYADKVEAETNEYLENLTGEKLQTLFEYKGRDGNINKNKIEDILMHIIEEEIHHRGEILCLYWQHNLQAPYTSYTLFKTQTTS